MVASVLLRGGGGGVRRGFEGLEPLPFFPVCVCVCGGGGGEVLILKQKIPECDLIESRLGMRHNG